MIPEELLPWLLYGGSAVLYTGLVFRDGLLKKRALTATLAIHAGFLSVLLAVIKIARYAYPRLPEWLGVTVSGRGAPISLFEFVIIVAMVGIHFLERRWLDRVAAD